MLRSINCLHYEIAGIKETLKRQARKQGITENFGQKELLKLKARYESFEGNTEQAQIRIAIDQFALGAETYEGV